MKKLIPLLFAALITVAMFTSCQHSPEQSLTPEELAKQQAVKEYKIFYDRVNNENWKAESPDKSYCEYIKISEWTDDSDETVWLLLDYYKVDNTKITGNPPNTILPKQRPDDIIKINDNDWKYKRIQFTFVSQNELKITNYDENNNIKVSLTFKK